MNKKFKDKDLLVLYNKGLSDKVMANILDCDNSTICRRRIELHLPSNVQPQLTSTSEFNYSRKHGLEVSSCIGKRNYLKNRCNVLLKHKKYYELNRDVKLIKHKEYYAKVKDMAWYKDKKKEWVEENKEHYVEYHKKYAKRGYVKAKAKEYRLKNKSFVNGLTKAWYLKNRDSVLARQRLIYRCKRGVVLDD